MTVREYFKRYGDGENVHGIREATFIIAKAEKDFICNNYWKMSKDEIVNITKELIYGIYANVTKTERDAIMFDVAIELDEKYEEEYEV